jgi:hypothetical protein
MDANTDPNVTSAGNFEANDLNEADPNDIARDSSTLIEEAQKDFEIFKKTNPEIEKTSLRIIKGILKRLDVALTKLNGLKSNDRETYYHVTYNGTIVMYEICKMLRKANFYRLAARYMECSIISLDHNIILSTGKYLLWRIKNYIE